MPLMKCEKCGAESEPVENLGRCSGCGAALSQDWYGLETTWAKRNLGDEGWIVQQKEQAVDARTGDLVMRYGTRWRRCTLIIALLVVIGYPLQLITGNIKTFFYGVASVGMVIFGLFLAWDAWRFAIRVSATGLHYRWWAGRRFIRWEDIAEVSYDTISLSFTIWVKDGLKINLNTVVSGLSAFLEQCERHLPLAALEKARGGYALLVRTFPEETNGPALVNSDIPVGVDQSIMTREHKSK